MTKNIPTNLPDNLNMMMVVNSDYFLQSERSFQEESLLSGGQDYKSQI